MKHHIWRLLLTVFLLAASLSQSAAAGVSQDSDLCALIPDVDKAEIELSSSTSCIACFDRDEEMGWCTDSITISYLGSEESAQDSVRIYEGEGCEIGSDGEILRPYTERPLGDLAFYCADDSEGDPTFQQVSFTKGPYLVNLLNQFERNIDAVGEAIIARIEALGETGDAESEEGEEQGEAEGPELSEAEAEKKLRQALEFYSAADLVKVLECPKVENCPPLHRAVVTRNEVMHEFDDLVTDASKPLSKESALFWGNAVALAAMKKPDGKSLFPSVQLSLDIMGQMAWTAAESENSTTLRAANRFLSLLIRQDSKALGIRPGQ